MARSDLNRISTFVGKAAKKFLELKKEQEQKNREQRIIKETERRMEHEQHAAHASHLRTTTIDLSVSSVARSTLAILGIFALAWFLMQIQSIIILFLIATFIAITINPLVDRLQSWHVPRILGILLIYVAFFGVVGTVISSFIPILTTEIPALVTSILSWVHTNFSIDTSFVQNQITQLQDYLNNIQQNLTKENLQTGYSLISSIGQNAFVVFKGIAGGIITLVFILVIAFFMVLEEDGIKRFFLALFPRRHHPYITEKAALVEQKFGAWVRGIVILMLAMGVVSYIAFSIIGVHYALSLAMLVGLGELLPYVGPIISLTPALIIAGNQGGIVMAIAILITYVVLQQLENNVLVPVVMEKAVGLSPVVIMFAMFVGSSFPEYINPIVGIILSVPVTTAISIFVYDYTEREK